MECIYWEIIFIVPLELGTEQMFTDLFKRITILLGLF